MRWDGAVTVRSFNESVVAGRWRGGLLVAPFISGPLVFFLPTFFTFDVFSFYQIYIQIPPHIKRSRVIYYEFETIL
jgi:hypothetical protein